MVSIHTCFQGHSYLYLRMSSSNNKLYQNPTQCLQIFPYISFSNVLSPLLLWISATLDRLEWEFSVLLPLPPKSWVTKYAGSPALSQSFFGDRIPLLLQTHHDLFPTQAPNLRFLFNFTLWDSIMFSKLNFSYISI